MNGKILYKRIYEDLVNKIKIGEYKDGDYLPAQEELSRQYDVSLVTIKKAVEYSEKAGILVRQKGKRAQISAKSISVCNCKILMLNIVARSRASLKKQTEQKPKLKLTIENSWYSQIINALVSSLPAGVDYLEASYYRDQVLDDYENTIIPKYDRILLFGNKNQKMIDFLRDKGKKIAVFGNFSLKNCAIVTNNDRDISRMAVNYLISLGHKRIAFIGSDSAVSGDFSERYYGYREALTKANLANDGSMIRWCKRAIADEGYNNMADILYASFYSRPTAVFCANDHIAYGALVAIRDNGYECPRDISIIGVDNSLEICKKTEPTLSSIDKNFRLAGVKLAEILTRSQWKDDKSLIKCDLVIRESAQEPKNR